MEVGIVGWVVLDSVGSLQNAPEIWEVRDSQNSKEGTLDEMPNSEEKELEESTSSRKTGHQVEG